MQVLFKIIRQNPNSAPNIQEYKLEVSEGSTVLDCLNRIKWEQDGTLAFRKNCRNTICGSCAMRINGRSTLACKENIGAEVARLHNIRQSHSSDPALDPDDSIPEITIAPMGNMPVIKDLVVDMTQFWDNLEAVDPYVSTRSRQVPEREFLQSPEERARLDAVGNCILCGACYSECNAREVNPDFVGPHALAKAYRTIADSRDDRTEERLNQYDNTQSGVWGCTRCYYCNAVCPMEVAPMDRIGQVKHEILDRRDRDHSRPVRHRKVLVDLVERGGWVDERKFALLVVGNFFRDLRGLLSLGPVGLQMVTHRKFPFSFEPSEGTNEVRSLIEAVRKVESESSEPIESKL